MSEAYEWEFYRRLIYRLYVVEELSCESLATYMSVNYGFHQAKRAYEYRIGKWGYRQKHSADTWMWAGAEIQRRTAAGKESEVISRGAKLSVDKVSRRIGFWDKPKLANKLTGTMPDLTGTTCLYRPDHATMEIQTSQSYSFDSPWPMTLPSLLFSKFLNTIRPQSDFITKRTLVPVAGGKLEEPPVQTIIRDYLLPLHLRESETPIRRSIIRGLRTLCPELHEGDHSATVEILWRGSREAATFEFAKVLVSFLSNNMRWEFQKMMGGLSLEPGRRLIDFLRGLGVLTKFHVDIFSQISLSTSRAFLDTLVIHALHADDTEVLGWLLRSHIHLDYRIQVSFESGSHRHHFRLSRGAVCMLYRFKPSGSRLDKSQTLLQFAVLLGSLQTCTFLINEGVKVQDTCGEGDPSALEYASSLRDWNVASSLFSLPVFHSALCDAELDVIQRLFLLAVASGNLRLVEKLLGIGASVSKRAFRYATEFAGPAMIDLLVSFATDNNTADSGVVLPTGFLGLCLRRCIRRSRRAEENVHALLNLGANPNEEGIDGSLPLELAITFGSGLSRCRYSVYKVCWLLFKYGAKTERPRSSEYWGRVTHKSALRRAIEVGHLHLVKLLVRRGAKLDYPHTPNLYAVPIDDEPPAVTSSVLLTALELRRWHIAKHLLLSKARLVGGELRLIARKDDSKLFCLFIKHGAEFGLADFNEAVRWRTASVLDFCLKNVDDMLFNTSNMIMVLKAALIRENHKIIDQIRKLELPYDSRLLLEATIFAARTDRRDLVERLVAVRQPLPRDEHETAAVAIAVIKRDKKLLSLLGEPKFENSTWELHIGGYLGEQKLYGLHNGLHNGNFTSGPAELENLSWFAMCNECGENCRRRRHILHFAAEVDIMRPHIDAVATLLDFGVTVSGLDLSDSLRVNIITLRDLELILEAARSSNTDHVLRGVSGDRLLVYAILYNYDDNIAETLVKANVSIDAAAWSSSDWEKDTVDLGSGFINRRPVQAAVEKCRVALVKKLVDAGADVNGTPFFRRGATCLQIAAMRGYIELVRYLLDEGASINAPRARWGGRTAMEGAAENGRLDITSLLLCRLPAVPEESAQRIQVIRAVKFAVVGQHYEVGRLLKKYIAWTSEDQHLYDAIDLRIEEVVDEMTQPLSAEEEDILVKFGDIWESEDRGNELTDDDDDYLSYYSDDSEDLGTGHHKSSDHYNTEVRAISSTWNNNNLDRHQELSTFDDSTDLEKTDQAIDIRVERYMYECDKPENNDDGVSDVASRTCELMDIEMYDPFVGVEAEEMSRFLEEESFRCID